MALPENAILITDLVKAWPDAVPTLRDSGEADIVNRIQQEVAKSLATPAMKEKMLSQGANPSGNTPAQFAALIESEHRKWAQVVKVSGARID